MQASQDRQLEETYMMRRAFDLRVNSGNDATSFCWQHPQTATLSFRVNQKIVTVSFFQLPHNHHG